MDAYLHPDLAAQPDFASAVGFFERWMAVKMADQRQPAASVALLVDQTLVYARGFGHADLESATPARADTIYRIASNTKLFTSIAIMQLRDAGKLRLDDRVADILPWFNIRQRFPDAKPITVRHLLTHTSGLPRDDHTPMWTETAYPTREQIIAALPARETALVPETRWKYSNLGFALLGEIVESVGGQPYADFIHARIIDPLGMADTFVHLPDALRPRLATGYSRLSWTGGQRRPEPFTISAGYTAAFNNASTVEDLAKFLMLQFRLDQTTDILRGDTLREMHRPHWVNPDWKAGWGLGFSVAREGDKTWVGHGGALLGHFSLQRFNPDDKSGIVVLTNTTGGDTQAYFAEMARGLAPLAVKALAKAPEKPVYDPAWDALIGAYHSPWWDAYVLRDADRLVMRSLQFPELPPGALIPEPATEPGGSVVFRMKEGGNDGELVFFERDAAGAVTRLRVAGEYLLPFA
jgi:CubicO group peptidase (beta-lactamase class C family)